MQTRHKSLLVICALWINTLNAADLLYVVSSTGDDANPGTQAAPFRTIERARDTLRPLLTASKARIARISLEGTFALSEPLLFTPDDGGHQNLQVIYEGVGNAALIHGGIELNAWESDGNTWQTQVPPGVTPRDLYLGKARATRARHPNTDWLRIEKAFPDNRTGFFFGQGDFPEGLDPQHMEVVLLHDWSISRIPVLSIDDGARRLSTRFPIGCKAPHYAITHFEKHPRYALENHAAFLDAPGEWFFDPDMRTLRVMSKNAPAHAVVPVATGLIEIRGTPERPVRNLHFRNLHFAYTDWALPPEGYVSGQAAVHERRDGSAQTNQRIFVPPAILADHAEGLHLTGCTLRNLGGSGIWLQQNCRASTVNSNHFFDIAANGVMIGEGNPSAEQTTRNIRISHNDIQSCGTRFHGAVGIWAGIVRDVRVDQNHIQHLPYTGISIGWKWDDKSTPAGNNIIADNHIHRCMQLLSDGGGIYTLGNQPNSQLIGNRIHDIPLNAGKAESNGMFLDQGSTGFSIMHNTIYGLERSPLRFHQAGTNTVQMNTLICAPGIDPIRYNNTPAERITVIDNEVTTAPKATPARPAAP
ncbi:MAG: hypothetical protein ACI9TH_004913 [Kiritimatiellia bacterium]|jgi:hypothetical protein